MPYTKPQHPRIDKVRHDNKRWYETEIVYGGEYRRVRREERQWEHNQKQYGVDERRKLHGKHYPNLRVYNTI